MCWKKKNKTNMTKYNRDLLLELTINHGINLWIFSQLFIEDGRNDPKDYECYKTCWRDISTKPLSKYDFTTVCKLLADYMKGK